MKIYAAPMEGITRHIFRNVHSRYYSGIDCYFSPFLSPKDKGSITRKEKRDIIPENNQEICLVPQILAKDAERFLLLAARLKKLGYKTLNLNLGCPARTVVSKGKGCGMLEDPEELSHFLDKIFSECELEISVKTRLGLHDPEEILSLIDVFNSFPLKELIIHARVRDDYYKNHANQAMFEMAAAQSIHSVCYNGDIFTAEDYHSLMEKTDRQKVTAVMLGRGLIANPQLAEQIGENSPQDLTRLEAFLTDVTAGYDEIMSGDYHTICKMKEIWSYILPTFLCCDQYKKKMRKVRTLYAYRSLVKEMFVCERSLRC